MVRLANYLRNAGASVWMDTSGIESGRDWWQEISKAIDDTEAFVCFLSGAYFESTMCRQELERAHVAGKQVVPVVIGHVSVPTELAWLSLIQWLDPSNVPSPQFAQSVLVAASSNPRWTELHRHLLQQTRQWERNGRKRRHLLRGADVAAAEAEVRIQRKPGQPQATPIIREFVEASRSAARLRRRISLSATAIVLVMATLLTSYAVVKKQQAEQQRATAEDALADAQRARLEAETQRGLAETATEQALNNQMIAEARELVTRSLTEDDPLSALLFAIEAEMRTPTPLPNAREAWARAVRRYGAVVATVEPTTAFEDEYSSVWSSDLDRVAVIDQSLDLSLRTPGGEPVGPLLTGPYLSAHWAPDDHVVIAGQQDGFIDLISPDGELLVDDATAALDVLGWSPDNLTVALAYNNAMVLLDTRTGTSTSVEIGETFIGNENLWEALWSPTGDRIAVRYNVPVMESQVNEGGFQVVDLSGVPLGGSHLSEGYDGLRPLDWIREGSALAVPTIDGQVGIFDSSGIEALARIETGSGPIVHLDASPDGSIATANSDGTVRIFDGSGQMRAELRTGDSLDAPPTGIRWSPSSEFVAVGLEDGTFLVFDSEGKPVGTPIGPSEPDALLAFRWNTTGDQLIADFSSGQRVLSLEPQEKRTDALLVADGATSIDWHPLKDRLAVGFPDWSVAVYDHYSDTLGSRSTAQFKMDYPHRGDTDRIQWSPDGSRLALTTNNGAVAVFDAVTGQMRTLLNYQDDDGSVVPSWSPDSSHLALVANGSGRVYGAETGELVIETKSESTDREINLLRNGIVLVRDDGVHVWQADSEVVASKPSGSGIPSLSTAPDGETFAVFTDKSEFGLYQLERPSTPIMTKHAMNGSLLFSWSPDSDLLAVGDSDGEIQVFDSNGVTRGDIVDLGESQIVALEWNSSGSMLAAADTAGRMSFIGFQSGELLTPISSGTSGTIALSWASDGRSLARLLVDGSVVIDHSWSESEVCQLLIKTLGVKELDRRLGGGQRSVCGTGSVTDAPPLPAAARRVAAGG